MNDNSQNIFRKESLERLSSPEQLDQLMQVIRSKSWIPLATLGALIFFALLWGIFGRIPITANGTGVLVRPSDASDELLGLTYFSSSDGSQIEPGMPIILVPSVAGSQQVGGIVGRVKEISEPPIATLDKARQALGSNTDGLQAETVEVIAAFDRDPSTTSGYRWTSTGGTSLKLMPGTGTTARITLEEKAPITFIFPFLHLSN